MDQNLMVVVALEGYAKKYEMDESPVFDLFQKHGIFSLLRSQYEVLHTQSLDESLYFVEDVLKRKN